MVKYITQYLFREFLERPKDARFCCNKPKIYEKKRSKKYNILSSLWTNKELEKLVLLKLEIPCKTEIIYGWVLSYGNLFAKIDLLIKNKEWTYDLVEIKKKTNIKDSSWQLLNSIVTSISFIAYVTKNVLWEEFSGKIIVAYLNGKFIKKWKISPAKLIKLSVLWDELRSDKKIEKRLLELNELMQLWERKFDKLFCKENYVKKNSELKNISTKWNKIIIKKDLINKAFSAFKFPLFFYDYETISNAIPILDGVKPWQHVVVQYSIHKLNKNWEITHRSYLLKKNILNKKPKNNKKLVDQFMKDIEYGIWTHIVWSKWFENTRNKEMWALYTEYQENFRKINANTFDLMTVFSKKRYVDKKLDWSYSLKKVLPVLTNDSYAKLEISDGLSASHLLWKLLTNQIQRREILTIQKKLLRYCKQDTLAMLKIWLEIRKKININ